MSNIPYLMDEPPISVYPSLAKILKNVNKAIMVQQVHFQCSIAKQHKNKYVLVDGQWWVYNSYQEWQEQFPWLSISTIKMLFGALEDEGIIISRQGVKDSFDRRKWYRVDYECLLTIVSSNGQNLSHVHQTDIVPSESEILSDDNRKSETPSSENKKSAARAKNSKSFEAEDVLIDHWAHAMQLDAIDLGADYHTKSDRVIAARLLTWSKPPTASEIIQCVANSDRPDYPFAFLEKDIVSLRATNAKSYAAAPSTHQLAQLLESRPEDMPAPQDVLDQLAKLKAEMLITGSK